jgi:hypothetical protein
VNGKKARALRRTVKLLTGIYPKSVPELKFKNHSWEGEDLFGKRIEGPFKLALPYEKGTAMHTYKTAKKMYKRGDLDGR